MERHVTTPEAQKVGATDASEQHFRDQGDKDDAADDATTLAFEGRMQVSGDDDAGGDPYNRTGRFKRAVR